MFGLTVFGQEGVKFENLTLQEALAKAKAEKKLVFVDCHTPWCCACKYMMKNVFPKKEAGDYFNSRFISVSYDMEKEENKDILPITQRVFPVFFILRPDGYIQHKMIGGESEPLPFIERVKRGANWKTSYSYLDSLYKKGKIKKMQLINYKLALDEFGEREKSEEVGEKMEVLLTEKDKLKKEFWPMIERSQWGTDNYKLVVKDFDVLSKRVGEEKVEQYIVGVFEDKLRFPIDSVKILEQMSEDLNKLKLPNDYHLQQKVELALVGAKHDIDKVISLAGKATSDGKVMFWPVINVLNVLKKNATHKEIEKLLPLKGECMKMINSPHLEEFATKYFKEFEEQASEKQ